MIKILAAIKDVNKVHQNYLDNCISVAKKLNAEMVLISNYVPMTTPSMSPIVGQGLTVVGPERVEREINAKAEKLKNIVSELIKEYPRISSEFEVSSLASAINQKMEKGNSLFVMLEKENQANFWNEFFGTKETHLVHNIDIPILILPDDYNFVNPRNMLFVLYPDVGFKDLSFINSLSKVFGMKMHYLIDKSGMEKSRDSFLKKVEYNYKLNFSDLTGQVTFFKGNEDEIVNKILESEKPAWLGYQKAKHSGFFSKGKMHHNHLILDANRPLLMV